jgi:hypothetical protein
MDASKVWGWMRRCRMPGRSLLALAGPSRLVALGLMLSAAAGAAQDGEHLLRLKTVFRVKYVSETAAYLEAGRAAGLTEGQKLEVKRTADATTKFAPEERVIAELEVISVASSSAVCEIRLLDETESVRPGDMAHLSRADVEKLQSLNASIESRKYSQVITFTDGDPLDEEAREYIPRPPLPEINRARGRFALEYGAIREPKDGMDSYQLGVLLRMDMTRIGGTHWNFGGHYRGRLNSRSNWGPEQETLTDLVNRTYHLNLTYNNPDSRFVAGFGRLYLPWASSLNTIDGGYVGRRVGSVATFGLFGGSAPDPTSWNYDPRRQLAGVFANFAGGSFESFRYTSTTGVAVSRVDWKPDRQYGFFENGFFYKTNVSIYHNLETDLISESPEATDKKLVPSRSFLTARFQPVRMLSFDFSHNYFRTIPTFDARLVSTGLVDKLLFQGVSGGIRLELPHRISLYSSLGRSDRTGDARNSWNQMYGVTLGRVWKTGFRLDLRHSTFDSSFGKGSYRSVTLAREIGNRFRFDLQGGQQDFVSSSANRNRARWMTSNGDWLLGKHYFLGGGVTLYRGDSQTYDQWFLNLGYRF